MEPTDQKSQDGSVGGGDRRNLLRDALAALDRMQARLNVAESARHEPIAIVGIACRLPGGLNTPEDYWQALVEGRDVVTEIPADRWEVDAYYNPDPSHLGTAYTKAGGFLDEVDLFEPALFGMSPREAAGVDPQQRLLLETAWEALERAGIAPDSLNGSRTGVFVGVTSTDYAQRIDVRDPARSDIYLATGTALNTAAGRISFTFGLQGPCMAIDTACSSSLVAIHTACQSLRNRESNLVLAGGVNVMLSPDPFVLISKWGMLSPDGRCKTFDAAANGFVRGEGCVLFALERQEDAIANGHRILALIRGSAINQDGRSSGLTVPNGLAQQAVIRQALEAAKVKAAQVGYVEAHGTGTSLGDPIEVEAIAAVYGAGRAPAQPLELGSVKSNIGHLEAASGAAGLAKLVVSLRNRQIPASLHVQQLTPAIPWASIPVTVSTALHEWKPYGGARLAGISAFGFSGMNAHLIVQEPPEPPELPESPLRSCYCLPLSGRNDTALSALADRYADLFEQQPELALADVCRTAGTGRASLARRFGVVASGRVSMIQALRAAARNDSAQMRGTAPADGRVRLAFLFTGQGSQYPGMARELYSSEAVFREVIDRCASVLDPLLELPLRDLLFGTANEKLNQTGFTQPALFSVEVALAFLWRSWGVVPSVVIGHSVGEFAAAVLAGVFSLEDGARLIAARGRLMQALPAGGVMAAVQGDARATEEVARTGGLSIAASNAPDQLVIAGEERHLATAAAALEALGLKVQRLHVSHAFHSHLMEPMLTEFRKVAEGIKHQAPKLPWVSNLDGKTLDWSEWGTRMPEYWTRHVRETVAFAKGVATLKAMGCSTYVEIGPHPVLLGMARQCLAEDKTSGWIPSLKRGERADLQVYGAMAQVFARGVPINWNAVYPRNGRLTVQLPTYPFQRDRYIVPPKKLGYRAATPMVHELLGSRRSVAGVAATFEREIRPIDPKWLGDHVIASEVVVPMTGYLDMCLVASRLVLQREAVQVRNFEVFEPLMLKDGQPRVMQTIVDERTRDSVRVRIFSRDEQAVDASWIMHAQCLAEPADGQSYGPREDEAIGAGCTTPVDVDSLYESIAEVGADFGPTFRGLRQARMGTGEAVGAIARFVSGSNDADSYAMHPALLDACLHVSALVLKAMEKTSGQMYLPVGVDCYRLLSPATQDLIAYARLRKKATPGDVVSIDIDIRSENGEPVAILEGLRCRRASRNLFKGREVTKVAEWCYAIAWQEKKLPAAAPAVKRPWLVLGEGGERTRLLVEELRQRGAQVLLAEPAGQYREVAAGNVEFDATQAPDYSRLLARFGPVNVVSLVPLRVPPLRAGDVPSECQAFGTDAALLLLQSLESADTQGRRLYLATASAECVDGGEAINVQQAPVAGFARVAAVERPALSITHVDLDAEATPTATARLLADELLADTDETRVALRKGQRFVARLRHLRPDAQEGFQSPHRLTISEKGTLENLQIVAAERRPPGAGEVEIRVMASGLNFRDVLNALGMYPGEIPLQGSDCAGEVVAVGSGVSRFAVGDRVVAMVEGAFASHATTRWEFAAPLPKNLSFEQGAAVPTAYLTAEITLNLIAGMKCGDKVLIHSGAGGVGMAAIALARKAGAEIFATAGSPDKRAVLKSLGVTHVLDSRSTSFADEILRITKGQGVDIVLNSLAGEMLDRSFEVLRPGGTFLEIGKRGLWSHERVEQLGRRLCYHIVDCNDNARDTPELVGEIFTRVLRDIDNGMLPILPCTTFILDQAVDAFRYMAQARHIGRVVFRHRIAPASSDERVRAGLSYVVTGGLRGLGLAAARWLVSEGARHLVLVARSEPDAVAAAELDQLRQEGAQITTLRADVGTAEGIARISEVLQSAAQLGGLIHCAGILDDGLLDSQTPARFAAVMQPKADAVWRLQAMLEANGHQPEFFVTYSSMSAVFGSPGQGNYVAANAFLDALANQTIGRPMRMLSIGWGAWSETGMAARGGAGDRAAARGMPSLSVAQGLAALGTLVRSRMRGCVAVAPIDWRTVATNMAGAIRSTLLEDVLQTSREDGGASRTGESAGIGDYTSMDPATRRVQLVELVHRELGFVLGRNSPGEQIPHDESFTSLGLDSLTSVELRNRLQGRIGKAISATSIFECPTVISLADHLDSLYEDAEPHTRVPSDDREEFVL